jgi:PAS domain S-box-containing protein
MNQRLDGDADALGRLLEAVPEIVVVVDLEGTILYINHVEKGYDREQVLGMKAEEIMPPGSRRVFRGTLDSVRRTGVTEEFEVEATSPTGEPLWYQSRMIPMRENGEVIGAMILATNVSELKATRAEVERKRRIAAGHLFFPGMKGGPDAPVAAAPSIP